MTIWIIWSVGFWMGAVAGGISAYLVFRKELKNAEWVVHK